jgi:hypothetical protein
MPDPLPNFLIVGAPKAGTTALAAILEHHPEVYVAPLKEPKYFSCRALDLPLGGPGDRFAEALFVRTEDAYRRLFRRARGARAVGEASVDLLYYHRSVIPEIRRLLGDPRIVISLRDPVARAVSAYSQLVRDGRETLSFADALAAEERRRAAGWEFMWSYVDVGRYRRQVAAYLESFSRVHVLLHDDLRARPGTTVREVLRFLAVDDRVELPLDLRSNPSGVPRNPILRHLLRPRPALVAIYRLLLEAGLPERRILGLVDRLRPQRTADLEIPPAARQSVADELRPDVAALATLIGRDLSGWCAATSSR